MHPRDDTPGPDHDAPEGSAADRRVGSEGRETNEHRPPQDAPGRNHREDADMIATRQSLPATRDSITHKFSIERHEGYLTIGLYSNGAPGEIFIKMSKEGSTISGMAQAFCRAFSLALQHGLSINDAVARFKGMRFEPMGSTSNPDIPQAQSIVDYVAKYLELHYGTTPRR